MSKSLVEISVKNIKDINKAFSKKETQMGKAVNATIKDFKSRGPGWISQEVTGVYNVKKKDVTSAKKGTQVNGTVKIGKTTVDNIEIIYEGKVLTPTHFGMKPKTRPKKNAYNVTAEIYKGSRVTFPHNVFLTPTGATWIPFQREGAARLPIKAVKTVSVPQMIGNENVSEKIHTRVNEELEKRLQHNINRYNK